MINLLYCITDYLNRPQLFLFFLKYFLEGGSYRKKLVEKILQGSVFWYFYYNTSRNDSRIGIVIGILKSKTRQVIGEFLD
jgi:hypothetical protein